MAVDLSPPAPGTVVKPDTRDESRHRPAPPPKQPLPSVETEPTDFSLAATGTVLGEILAREACRLNLASKRGFKGTEYDDLTQLVTAYKGLSAAAPKKTADDLTEAELEAIAHRG